MKTANIKESLPLNPMNTLSGRSTALEVENRHFVNGRPIKPPFDQIIGDVEQVLFGLGCFWGAERKYWQLEGVYTTAVGYAGGQTPNPTYEEVCTGRTGHAEVVLVVYQPSQTSFAALLKAFFESHDPTQGMRQGNDIGTQYRSAIYTFTEQQAAQAQQTLAAYQSGLTEAGYGTITTELLQAPTFFYAENYHQQYLAKNPNGYCGLGGTGVSCAL